MFDENKITVFDGAMGTMIQKQGLRGSKIPELYNITEPQVIQQIHRKYIDAGCDIVTTNTFGANRYKLSDSTYTVNDVIGAAVKNAKKVSKDRKVALDIGPVGMLMEPSGPMSFEQAYELFREQVLAGAENKVDLIIIETLSDIYEAKAAVLAAKENSHLPVICTMTLGHDGRTFTGTDILTMVNVLEGLGVDALGLNCSLGPDEMYAHVKKVLEYSSVPVIVQPNAGLPKIINGQTVYGLTAEYFVKRVCDMVDIGVRIVGGCCGTDESFIKKLSERVKDKIPKKIFPKEFTMISSYCRTVLVGDKVTLIGERINPTGKPKLKKALEEKNYTYILGEAVKQNEEGAEILDVNAGLPGIEEKTVLPHIIRQIQKVCDIPLQIDSSDYETMENAARVYNGKAVINSVNGKAESMEKVFPIAKKYGCCVIGLTLDENGIPKTAEKRVEIAQKIVSTAQEYGIPKKNILIDCLVLTASAEQENIIQTLKALRDVKYKLNVKTVLGVSNVSYGLPSRELLNKTFFVMAMSYGLDCAIVNTGNVEMMGVYDAFNVLSAKDLGSGKYIKKYAQQKAELPADKQENQFGLEYVLSKGLKGSIRESTLAELNKRTPMQIIDEIISPLLQTVGKKYENAELFLPQLMQTAEAVKAAFEVLKDHMKANGQMLKKGKILLATVRGDIHDIGKNIVKVVLENHGYEVIDLGKDVSKHDILKAAIENKVRLIGLSAIMTTTVSSMESTIKYIKDNSDEFVFIVGGAVLNEEYATMIGADYYAKDALQAAEIVNSIFRE